MHAWEMMQAGSATALLPADEFMDGATQAMKNGTDPGGMDVTSLKGLLGTGLSADTPAWCHATSPTPTRSLVCVGNFFLTFFSLY